MPAELEYLLRLQDIPIAIVLAFILYKLVQNNERQDIRHTEQSSRNNGTLEKLIANQTSTTANVDKLTSSMEALLSSQAGLVMAISTTNELIKETNTRVSENTSQTRDAQAKQSEVIREFRYDTKHRLERIERLELSYEGIKKEVDEIRKSVDDMKRMLKELLDRPIPQTSQIEQMQGTLNQLMSRLEAVADKTQVDDLKSSMLVMSKELIDLKNQSQKS